MAIEFPEPVARPRLSEPAFDEKLVRGLLLPDKAQRDNWLVHALQQRSRQTLASVEEALARQAGDAGIHFFQPSGTVQLAQTLQKAAIEQIMAVAQQDKLLEDPVFTQSLMPLVGKTNNRKLLTALESVSAQALHIFQLLGVQMQLAVMVAPRSET